MRLFMAASASLLLLASCGGVDGALPLTDPTTTVASSSPNVASPSVSTGVVPMADNTMLLAETPQLVQATTLPVQVDVRSITIGGLGTEYAAAVRCILDLGVTSRGPSVQTASDRAAAAGKAMTDALAAAGVESTDVQTSEFSVNTYYDDYPVIGGYETHIGYRVALQDMDSVGAVLGNAISAGGDDVRAWGVRFETDPGDLIEPARVKAWADAEGRARSLAALAGEPLGEVLDVHEKVLINTSQGMYQGGEGDSATFDIPVSPGISGVTVLLTVTYAIGD